MLGEVTEPVTTALWGRDRSTAARDRYAERDRVAGRDRVEGRDRAAGRDRARDVTEFGT